ncbi:sigma factor-like helix-turn-helix DNA-binding protein [Delftia tsuruhatensis]|uniref:sigma factor-like helix-turn-helix DNA-binding protein n=1 Tax=Delftia tsuruhatensis TaxID=180282 RepID=UPI0008E1F78C|nr:sigma factor-like helix-turn-helix DNA-binding protein [Delftia tsuruhatensis]SFB29062.1 Sigma-70, region 4 [Delftia tsuruhatensis]
MNKSDRAKKAGLANAKNFNRQANQSIALDMYLNENLTQQEIANKLGVSQKTVSNYLKDFQMKSIRQRIKNNLKNKQKTIEYKYKEEKGE